MSTAAFLDTMVWLHFTPVEDIDWREFTRADDEVILVISRVTIRELNEQKDRAGTQRTRERARKALKDIETWLQAGHILKQPQISCRFHRTPPSFDLKERKLDPDWGDDQLLASILQYQLDQPAHEVVLVTDDTGARLAAKEFGISTLSMPDGLRLPPELGVLERENQELRNAIQKLTHALPKLDLRFKGGDQLLRLQLAPLTKPAQKLEDVMTQLRAKYPRQLGEKRFSLGGLNMIPESEYERYNGELNTFFDSYERYYTGHWEYFEEQSRSAWVAMELANTGAAPADDVDVALHFPDGLLIRTSGDKSLRQPQAPEPPVRPRSMSDMLRDSWMSAAQMTHYSPHLPTSFDPIAPNVSPLIIRETNSVLVETHVDRIKHGTIEELPRMHVTFEQSAMRSFSIDYILRPGSPPSETRKRLDVIVEIAER